MTLKDRFLEAINSGELGQLTNIGMMISVSEFKAHFNDLNARYSSSYLPSAAIEQGRNQSTHTQFLFRVSPGIYRVHPDVLKSKS